VPTPPTWIMVLCNTVDNDSCVLMSPGNVTIEDLIEISSINLTMDN
jgi:hypothetical protein